MLLWTLECMYLFELEFSSFLDIYPGVGLLEHMITLFFVFKGTSGLFSIVATPIYIPTNSVWGFPFLHTLSSIFYCRLLMMAILTRVRWYLIIVLICISLIINSIEHLFMCLLATWMSSLEKCLFRSPAYFFLNLFIFGCFGSLLLHTDFL